MIELKNMSFRYPTSKNKVFDDVSLDIEPGHIYGLLGKNGVGKSTLFRLISGVNQVTDGTIQTLGMDPFARDPEMLRQLFLIPEDMAFPELTIRRFAEYYGPFYPNFDMAALEKCLALFDVPEQRVSKMSLGQRKKAMVSFALSLQTEILLMDEPTNGMDIPSKRLFRSALADVGMSDRVMIISTHQVRDLEELIDAVIIVDGQKIVMAAPLARLLERYHFGELPEGEACLYEERIGGRRCGVSRLEQGQQPDKAMDMELLFNAAVSGAFQGEALL